MYVCLSTFSNIFSSETTGLIEAKFHVEPPWDGGTNICSNGPGHMTKVLKTLNNLLLRNQKADNLETWYVTSGTNKFVQIITGLTLTCFTAMSNLVAYAFVWEKGKTVDISETILVYDVKVGRCS